MVRRRLSAVLYLEIPDFCEEYVETEIPLIRLTMIETAYYSQRNAIPEPKVEPFHMTLSIVCTLLREKETEEV